uniref:TIL domain containing protein n=1 Tax=Rhipicephalus appendiculatus TaxID=34631 RepID=A0A131Z7Q1_RHIAP
MKSKASQFFLNIVIFSIPSMLCRESRETLKPAPGCYKPYEVRKTCASGNCAEATCRKPTIGPRCRRNCVKGCFCARGYYREDVSGYRWCVKWMQCPPNSTPPFSWYRWRRWRIDY